MYTGGVFWMSLYYKTFIDAFNSLQVLNYPDVPYIVKLVLVFCASSILPDWFMSRLARTR